MLVTNPDQIAAAAQNKEPKAPAPSTELKAATPSERSNSLKQLKIGQFVAAQKKISNKPVPASRGKRKSCPETRTESCEKENEHPNNGFQPEKSGSRSMEELVAAAMKQRFPRFKLDEVVDVLPRVGPGMNKPGGVARITSIHPDGFYDVKYIVGAGKETRVAAQYVLAPDQNIVDGSQEQEVKKRAKRSRVKPAGKKMASAASTKGSRAGSRSYKRSHPKQWTGKSSAQCKKANTSNEIESPPKKPVFVATGVSDLVMKRLENLAMITSGKVVNELTEEVTHVVTSTLKGSRVAAKRTLKYLHAVLQGKWIVSSEWVSGCLVAGRLLNEEQFEVTGDPKSHIPDAPRRARLSKQRALMHGLFKDHFFYLHGTFAPPKPSSNHLEQIILSGGGKVIKIFEQFIKETAAVGSQYRIVVCNCNLAFSEIFTKFKDANAQQVGHQVVDSDWILGSVSNFRILKFETVV